MRPYRIEDAETVIVAMGSVLGTIKDVVDQRRDKGEKLGVLGICSFRPFPFEQVAKYLGGRQALCVPRESFLLRHRGNRGLPLPLCSFARR